MNMKMKPRFAAILLALFLLVNAFALTAYAGGAVDDYNSGDSQSLTTEDAEELQDEAARVSAACDMDVAFFFASPYYSKTQTLAEFATEYYTTHKKLGENGLVLAIDRENQLWTIVAFGRAKELLTEELENELFAAYNNEDTYYGGVLAYLLLAEELFPPPPLASLARAAEGERLPRLIDDMNLLTEAQHAELLAKLDEISERQKFDVVVAIVPALDRREARVYAADFYEQNGFGYGGTQDGAILLLATEDRDFGFAAMGTGNEVFTPAGQAYLDRLYLPDLKKDNYFEAFMAFADAADDFVRQAGTGQPYDEGNIPKTQSEAVTLQLILICVSLAVGLILAWFITSRWKKQLHSAAQKTSAADYVRPGSLALLQQRDVFLFSNVTKTKRVKEDSSGSGKGGGGSSFSTSSGSRATGHSGKY